MVIIILTIISFLGNFDKPNSGISRLISCHSKNGFWYRYTTDLSFSSLAEISLVKFHWRDICLRFSTTISWLVNNSHGPMIYVYFFNRHKFFGAALIVIFSGENVITWNVEEPLTAKNHCSLGSIQAKLVFHGTVESVKFYAKNSLHSFIQLCFLVCDLILVLNSTWPLQIFKASFKTSFLIEVGQNLGDLVSLATLFFLNKCSVVFCCYR